MIAQDIIDNILDRIDIVKVIGDDITLAKRGVNYTGLCPFHGEKTPSFSVSAAKGICKCFSCGKGGNAIWYIQERYGLSYPEAVREAGRQCGVDVPIEQTPEQKQHNDDKASAMAVMTAANQIFQSNRKALVEAQEYLKKRQISEEIAELYGVGFANGGLNAELLSKGFDQKHIINTGTVYEDREKNRFMDSFYKRILFPFYNRTGEVVGHCGRALNDEVKPKYKNTGDTVLFNKGHFIYGLYQAKQEIQRQDRVYIVEGQIDVLSLAQVGVKNVVAGSGTAFTDYNRKQLHGLTANVVFIYDGDAAGAKAAQKLLPLFIQDEFKVRCIMLPSGKDPDDMAKLKGNEMAAWLDKYEKSYVEYLIKSLYSSEDDEFQKLDKTKQIISIIVLESDDIIRRWMLTQLSDATGYALADLLEIADKSKKPEAPQRFEPGFFGEEFAKDFIDQEEKEIHLVNDFERWQTIIGEKQPHIFYTGILSAGDIQRLSQSAERIVVHSPDMDCN